MAYPKNGRDAHVQSLEMQKQKISLNLMHREVILERLVQNKDGVVVVVLDGHLLK